MKKQINLALMAAFFLILGIIIGRRLQRPSAHDDTGVYAIANGQEIKAADILPIIQNDLNQIENNKYFIKKRATEDFIRRKLGLNQVPPPPPDWEKEEISQSELKNFLKERNLKIEKLSKNQLHDVINNMKLQKALQKTKPVDPLEQVNIKWLIKQDLGKKNPLGSGIAPRLGPAMAPVQVIFVGNYHCASCPGAEKNLQALREKYKDKIKVFYRFSQLTPGLPAATSLSMEASLCAADQDKFWPYHDALIGKFPQTQDDLANLAEKLKLNVSDFQKCVREAKHRNDVQKETAESQAASLPSEPTFLINGYMFNSATPLITLEAAVDQEQ